MENKSSKNVHLKITRHGTNMHGLVLGEIVIYKNNF